MSKRVIIIGASSGIGRELALLYMHCGYRVGLGARRVDELNALCALGQSQAVATELDVCAADCTERLQELIDQLGGMDIYIHSSGIGSQNPDLDSRVEQEICAVNVLGFTRMMDHAFAYFAERGEGQIVGISSVAGTRGLGIAAAYSASKAYQATYMQCLRQLTVLRGLPRLVITDIRPGFVSTPLLAGKRMPLMMQPTPVARAIYRAISQRKAIKIIDWRYRVLVGLWRLIPRALWERLRVG